VTEIGQKSLPKLGLIDDQWHGINSRENKAKMRADVPLASGSHALWTLRNRWWRWWWYWKCWPIFGHQWFEL